MLKFEFTIDETNVILGALAVQPYQQVADLIAKIRNQAAPQLGQSEAEQTEAVKAQ